MRWERAKAALGRRTRGIEGMGSPGARLKEEEGRPGGLRGKEWAGLAALPLLPLEFF